MRKILGDYPLAGPQKRVYRRCKKAYDLLPHTHRANFLAVMRVAIDAQA